MDINTLKIDKKEKKSKEIENKLRDCVLDIMDSDVESLDVDTFRNKILQAKIAMEYLRDIDMSFRIRFAQKLRIVSLIGSDTNDRKRIIKSTFKK